MTERKPHYIIGEALIEFHAIQNAKRGGKMALGEMYCLSCRKPKAPFGALVDYVPINGVRGRLVGLCDTCERPLQRFAKLSTLSDFAQLYDIAIKSNSQG